MLGLERYVLLLERGVAASQAVKESLSLGVFNAGSGSLT